MTQIVQFELHRLGWHGFQQLCHTITREVFNQSPEIFLDSHDGGRDGAFIGSWIDSNRTISGRFVVQCKYTSNSNRNLNLHSLKEDLRKTNRLVQEERCDIYILMTNAGVSGRVAEQIEDAFIAEGVREFRCYGSTWINQTLTENKRLRMLVPRVYGLGDLTQILDERSYVQAQAILESMRTSLAKVVRTETYDSAARALHERGFVLLLGEPATGKTTIAAQLVLASVDLWQSSAIKLDHPGAFSDRWNPLEPSQLFWIDDVFGSTQLDVGRAQSWTRAAPLLEAAIEKGARLIVTSRDYIYRAARPHLKPSAYPLLHETQIAIEVHKLTATERREIIYNHLKHGAQDQGFMSELVRFLEALADHPHFTPELARRLASPAYTRELERPLTYESLNSFFSRPTDFLKEVIEGLDSNSKAALGLIYLHRNFLPSPINLNAIHSELLERLGGSLSGATGSLLNLEGGLVKRTTQDGASGWTFIHPSLIDAYSELLQTPEFLHLALIGFPLSTLLHETTCGDVGIAHAVVLPTSSFQIVLDRLDEPLLTGHNERWRDRDQRMRYLAYRCDRRFLAMYIERHPDLLEQISKPGIMLESVAETRVAIRLHELGLLPENCRCQLVKTAIDYLLEGEDPGVLTVKGLRAMLTEPEHRALRDQVILELAPSLGLVCDTWWGNYDRSYGRPEEYFHPLGELIQEVEKILPADSDVRADCKRIFSSLQGQIAAYDWNSDDRRDYRAPLGPSVSSSSSYVPASTWETRSIFDDLLE